MVVLDKTAVLLAGLLRKPHMVSKLQSLRVSPAAIQLHHSMLLYRLIGAGVGCRCLDRAGCNRDCRRGAVNEAVIHDQLSYVCSRKIDRETLD